MSKLAALRNYRTALESAGVTEFKFPMTTADGVALVKELGEAAGEPLTAAAVAVEAYQGIERPTDDDALRQFLNNGEVFAADLWDKLEGREVEGVTIIRRR